MEEIKKEENCKLNKEKIGGIILGGGLVLASTILGFKCGAKLVDYKIQRGLNYLLGADHTLEEHILKTIAEVEKRK